MRLRRFFKALVLFLNRSSLCLLPGLRLFRITLIRSQQFIKRGYGCGGLSLLRLRLPLLFQLVEEMGKRFGWDARSCIYGRSPGSPQPFEIMRLFLLRNCFSLSKFTNCSFRLVVVAACYPDLLLCHWNNKQLDNLHYIAKNSCQSLSFLLGRIYKHTNSMKPRLALMVPTNE